MRFIGDISKLFWKQDDKQLQSFSMQIELGFCDNNSLPVKFNNLCFGYELMESFSFKIINVYSYSPTSDSYYISSDQYFIYSNTINNLTPGMLYKLKIWANNNNKYFESIYDITTPLPPSPYPSWYWDALVNDWKPPIPMPIDPPPDKWKWDEDIKNWIEISPAIVQ